MITTCKRLPSGNELYARFHTSDAEVVRGEKHPEGVVECSFSKKPTKKDKEDGEFWVLDQIAQSGILTKRPDLAKKVKFVY